MNKTKITSLIAGTALAAIAAGCTETATNNANTNVANANSNTAVVVNNNNNMNTSGVSTINGNANMAGMRGNYNARITREEYDRDKDRYGREAKDAGDTVGQGATDGWLWVKAKAALAAEDDLRDSTINVDVDNGVVTLRGDVASADQVKKADAAAKSIEGEKSVMNRLKVRAAGDSNMNRNSNMNMSNSNRKG
jgi:osmotically-inducible protein OsmY